MLLDEGVGAPRCVHTPIVRRDTFARWKKRSRTAGTATRRSCAASRSASSARRGSTPATSAQLPEPGTLHDGARRPHAGRHHARARRRAPRLPERLPAPRLPGRRGLGQARDDPVPVPRVDVRARRLAAERAALGGARRLPDERARPLPRRRRHVGPVPLRQHAARPGTAGGGARLDAGADRRARARRRRARLLHALGSRDRRELEGRLRELPRVLPLPGRAPAARGDARHLGRGVRALDRRPALEPARPDARRRRDDDASRRRAAAQPVPLPLAEPRRQHLPGQAEHLDRADGPADARPHLPLPRLLLRPGRRPGRGSTS